MLLPVHHAHQEPFLFVLLGVTAHVDTHKVSLGLLIFVQPAVSVRDRSQAIRSSVEAIDDDADVLYLLGQLPEVDSDGFVVAAALTGFVVAVVLHASFQHPRLLVFPTDHSNHLLVRVQKDRASIQVHLLLYHVGPSPTQANMHHKRHGLGEISEQHAFINVDFRRRGWDWDEHGLRRAAWHHDIATEKTFRGGGNGRSLAEAPFLELLLHRLEQPVVTDAKVVLTQGREKRPRQGALPQSIDESVRRRLVILTTGHHVHFFRHINQPDFSANLVGTTRNFNALSIKVSRDWVIRLLFGLDFSKHCIVIFTVKKRQLGAPLARQIAH
mmetsp:Transcript_59561/g.122031  ORF Transcript_59561/g.122031 Transcript_59561/m.122031 type:complete len:327 (-) Transcript_59561:603-1583(-)